MTKSSSYDDNRTAHFFKPYLPDRNGKKLPIPANFIENFKGKIPNKVTLKDLLGKSWQVELKKSKGRMFIDNGWERFVKDKSVEPGYFFTFRYVESSSSFIVKIFGHDGLKREDLVHIKCEEESAEQQSQQSDSEQNYEKRIPTRQKESPEGVEKYKSPSTRPRNIKRRKIVDSTPTNNKRPKIIESVVDDPTEIPRFRVHYRPSTPYNVHVPKLLLDRNNITLNQKMKMRDHHLKVWPLNIVHAIDGRTIIGGGWKDFLVHYKLNAEKDEITLEIVRGRGRDCKELKVNIKHGTPRGRKSKRSRSRLRTLN